MITQQSLIKLHHQSDEDDVVFVMLRTFSAFFCCRLIAPAAPKEA